MALKKANTQGASELEKATAQLEAEEMRHPNLDAPMTDRKSVV